MTSEAVIMAVGGVVYRRRPDGKILVLLIKKRGGFWTLPKGKLKPGEDPTTALVREIIEETGIVGVVESEVQTISYQIQKGRRKATKQVLYALVSMVEGELRPGTAEGIERVRWLQLHRALQRVGRPRVRRVLRAAAALLEVQRSVL